MCWKNHSHGEIIRIPPRAGLPRLHGARDGHFFTNGVAFSDLDKGALAMQQAVLKGQTTLEDGFSESGGRDASAGCGFM